MTLSAEAEASNGAAMTAGPNSGVDQNTDYVIMSPRLYLRVNFVKTGIHYIWVRGRVPGSDPGSNGSCHVGLDGVGVPSADRISSFGTAFGWSKSTMDGVVATVNVSSVGVHVVNLWMREDGFVADKIVLTTSDSFVPTGVGPSQSACGSTSSGTQTLFTTQTPRSPTCRTEPESTTSSECAFLRRARGKSEPFGFGKRRPKPELTWVASGARPAKSSRRPRFPMKRRLGGTSSSWSQSIPAVATTSLRTTASPAQSSTGVT